MSAAPARAPRGRLGRWLRRGGFALGGVAALLGAAHLTVRHGLRMVPPEVRVPAAAVERVGDTARLGRSWLTRRGGVTVVALRGDAVTLGYANGALLRERSIATEQALWGSLDRLVPSRVARALLLDLGLFTHRGADRGMSQVRREEIAAQALGFQPDPFADRLPTYQRLIQLNALYDIALGFEHSPLVGCTTFTATGPRVEGGALLARNFDFEVDPVFDREKVVYLVAEAGQLPFASVSWPGLPGVVSGLNAAGLAAVVHGARAGEPTTGGEPLVHAVRRVLGAARTTAEAVALLAQQPPMVSHLVILADAVGDARVVERVPGRAAVARPLPPVAAVTNHLEGPDADHPANRRVREVTSTLQRRARGDELVAALPTAVRPRDLLALLRDRRAAGGGPLPAGDRRAIDADIASHAVIFDTGARTLWVSEGPHLDGPLLAFPLERWLDADAPPEGPDERLPGRAPGVPSPGDL